MIMVTMMMVMTMMMIMVMIAVTVAHFPEICIVYSPWVHKKAQRLIVRYGERFWGLFLSSSATQGCSPERLLHFFSF